MKSIGRYMQIAALIILPLSMVMQVTDGLGRSFGVSDMVIMLVFGIAIFMLGRLIEGYAK